MEYYIIFCAVLVLILIYYLLGSSVSSFRPGLKESFRPGLKESFRPGLRENMRNRSTRDWDASLDENLTDASILDAAKGVERDLNWQEKLAQGLDPNIWDRQSAYIDNVKRFGGSPTKNMELEDMSRFASTVNYLGFKRPAYVRVNATNPFQPEEDTELFKMFKRNMM